MNLKKLRQTCLFALAILVLASGALSASVSQQKSAKEIVKSMTLEQKAQLVIGTGMYFPLPDSIREKMPPMFGGGLDTSTPYGKMVDKIRAYLPGTAGVTAEYPDLGITSQTLADGPAGLRISPTRPGESDTYYCTAFPIATVMASSWDTELVESVGKAMGKEVLEYGGDVLLAPALNIQRDPLCGRNFEYYSEDPLVAGKMAAAMVKGIQSNGIGTSIKHFAVNNQETNRMSVDVIVSERALREIYLKGFEITVKESEPWTVMSSYNKVNGVYTSESHDLLTKILRDDWGYEGYVMTDWGGGSDVVAQMIAGNDMIQPGSPQAIKTLIEAVESDKLDVEILNTNVERILNIMMETPRYKGYKISNKPDLKAHAEVTRQAATDGMVLLENNGALPFAKSIKNVAAFGNTSYDFISGGTGSGDVNEAYTISLMQGLQNAGFETYTDLKDTYENYMAEARKVQDNSKNFLAAMMGGKIPVAEMPLDASVAADMAAKADIALITIGRNAGEGGDREAIEGDFYLNQTEKDMIKTVTEAFHAKGKKSVVILNVGGVVETASWSNIPDAVLCAWQPGQEGGNSIVDVLSGKVNPSGKLAQTFPVKYEDGSSSDNFPGEAIKVEGAEDNTADQSGFSMMRRVPWEVVYEEDIYVGYRYFNTFDVPVAYEFGYGKSYTTFEYSNLKLSDKKFDGKITVSIDVKNTGDVAGREVVQVYASAPGKSLEKPEEELVAFGKTALLNPGKSETLSFDIDATLLASFDEASTSWITEAGDYTVKVGASSKDIKEKAAFSVANDIIVEKVSKAMVPVKDFEKLHR
ncbi:glycoside hydrolase family 3 C-terminal domain-containing protein [Draconibacterium sp. IB214405]|uniref:glycoside hydrolase family 3 C-terminal domain-containing protein n=1 Tax=Draconibacterium sp. IB214405 TaxID=3097352 RepID=UPI002A0ED850|nr:glycoside hydrolase family 3 C-terminal domain-containing protein [Draconibacterium sp. IB214405]MDX8338903.1 glycoside hydrolase family 3 C-terminal domain-containing protein [Draconibacterium sp. IB214405]